jgi:hypothetical protein
MFKVKIKMSIPKAKDWTAVSTETFDDFKVADSLAIRIQTAANAKSQQRRYTLEVVTLNVKTEHEAFSIEQFRIRFKV